MAARVGVAAVGVAVAVVGCGCDCGCGCGGTLNARVGGTTSLIDEPRAAIVGGRAGGDNRLLGGGGGGGIGIGGVNSISLVVADEAHDKAWLLIRSIASARPQEITVTEMYQKRRFILVCMRSGVVRAVMPVETKDSSRCALFPSASSGIRGVSPQGAI